MGYLLTYQNWFLSWSTLFLRKGWVLTSNLTWPYSQIIVRSVFWLVAMFFSHRLWYVLSLAGPLVVMHTGSSVNRTRHISNVLWRRYLCIVLCIIPNYYFDINMLVLNYSVCFYYFKLLKRILDSNKRVQEAACRWATSIFFIHFKYLAVNSTTTSTLFIKGDIHYYQ